MFGLKSSEESSPKLKVGDLIPVPESAREAIKELVEADQEAQAAMQHFAHVHRKRHDAIWRSIRSCMPEIEGWVAKLESSTMEVKLLFPPKEKSP